MSAQKIMKITRVSVLVLLVLGIGLYALILWEGSSARKDAPALEANVAQWLLHYTVPADFRAMKNPLDVGSASAEVEAGHAVYTQKCEICHAYDGGGKTEIGSGEYPRPPDLRSADVQRMSDGELFYHLKNGIRHTGMPAWTLARSKALAVDRVSAASAPHRAASRTDSGRTITAGRRGALRGIGRVQGLSYRDLRSLAEDPHGECGSGSSRPIRKPSFRISPNPIRC